MTTQPLSFGDTFTLPITGDATWHISDTRPVSYLPPENLAMPHHNEVARAVCVERVPKFGTRSSYVARYEVGVGWVLFGNSRPADEVASVEAELNALDVALVQRTDEEWRGMHLARLREELEQALGTTDLGGPNRPLASHPLIPDEQVIAFAVATVAEIASKRPGAELFDPIYWAVLDRLRA